MTNEELDLLTSKAADAINNLPVLLTDGDGSVFEYHAENEKARLLQTEEIVGRVNQAREALAFVHDRLKSEPRRTRKTNDDE